MRVECTHCGEGMSRSQAADGHAYYSCPSCGRTFHSAYEEVFRKAAGARVAREDAPPPPADPAFDAVKARLDAWMRRLDDADPLRVLGVRPGTPLDEVRRRYKELALAHHPDRGGDPKEMRRIADAYDRIRARAVPPVPAPPLRAELRATPKR